MKKLDYESKHSYGNPALNYDVHWWSNRTTDYHCHTDYYELFVSANDGLCQTYNGESRMLCKHTVYIVPQRQYHRIDYVDSQGEADFFNVSVNTDLFERNIEMFSPRLAKQVQGVELISIPLDDTEYLYLLNISNKLTYILDETARLQLLRLYLATVAVLYDIKVKNVSGLSQTEIYAADLQTRIDNLEFNDKDISEAYRMYPVSPSILIKAFKNITGYTIDKYRIQRRMKYACSLLANTDFTVLQVCSAAGYDSLSHFIDNFKEYTGYTPKNYRKNYGGLH